MSISAKKEKEVFSSEEVCLQKKDAKYNKGKWIYMPKSKSNDSRRYILGISGCNQLIIIGINPPTAIPNKLDKTLKSVVRITKYNHFDSFIMLNVYAQRATSPDNLDRTLNESLHHNNIKAVRFILRCLNKTSPPKIWAAWGNLIEKRTYLKNCLKEIICLCNEFNAEWFNAGSLTKKGHPHHPLYLKGSSELLEFDINNYINKL